MRKRKVGRPKGSRNKLLAQRDDPKVLRKWAVEMAVRWPTVTHYSGGSYGGVSGGGSSSMVIDADVIARAEKIIAWVEGRNNGEPT